MLERIDDYAQAVQLAQNDPWVRWSLPDPLDGRVWRGPDTLVVERRGRRHSLVIIPLPGAQNPAAAMARTLGTLKRTSHIRDCGVRAITVPQQYLSVLLEHLRVLPGGDWAWLWTQEQPEPVDAENRLVALDDTRDAEAILALSQAHSPTAEGEPGTGLSEHWLGIYDGGELITAGALQRLASGVPYLAGIVVHSNVRRQGLGAAVTAGLTRVGLADSGVCTLSMYTDRDASWALYAQVGYRLAWAWASRRLPD